MLAIDAAVVVQAMQAKHFQEGPVHVDNEQHESLTVVTIIASIEVEGALLKVASALTGAGCSIAEGLVEVISASSACVSGQYIALTGAGGSMQEGIVEERVTCPNSQNAVELLQRLRRKENSIYNKQNIRFVRSS